MRERRLILDEQLSHFEEKKELTDGLILEIYRRLELLDEIESWNLSPEQESTAESPATDQLENDAEEEIEWVEPAYPLQEGMDGGSLN